MMENIFKEKFEHFEAAPSAGLFDAIIAQRRRKKRLIWIWSAASVLLLGTAYFAFTTSQNSNTTIENDLVEQTIQSTTENTDEALLNEDLLPASNESENSILHIQEATTPNQNPINMDKNASQTARPVVVQELPVKPMMEELVANDEIKNKDLANKFLEIQKSEKNNDVKKAKFFVKDKELVVDAIRKNVATQLPEVENEDSNPIENTDKDKDQNDAPKTKDPLDDDLGDKLPKLSKWSIAFTAGPGIGGRTLSGNENVVNARNAAETSKLSYGFDLRAAYALNPYWNIQTGVNYIQRNENFNHVVESMHISSREVTKEITIIHPVLGEIKKEVVVTETDTAFSSTSYAANNRYSSVSIPLSIERMFPIGQKFAMLARTGIQFGVNQTASGSTVNPENQAVSMSNLPLKQAGVNRIELGIGAAYRLNHRITLLVYPQGNLALQSVYKKSAAIEQKDFGLYTHFGLKIDL